MTIAILGGAGFIGRRVVKMLADEGEDVVSLDVADATWVEREGVRARSQLLDLSNFEEVIGAFTAIRPKIVVNLGYMRETFPREAFLVNVLGMDNCFEAARLCDVRHVIYASSIAVNGRQAQYGDRAISETDPTFPTYQYAVHKVFNEWQASEYRSKHGMCVTGVRVAHAAAPGKLVGAVDHVRCIVEPAAGKPIELDYFDKRRCVVHVDDIARVFCKIAEKECPNYDLYNTGGETLSLGEIAGIVRDFIPDARISFREETGGDAGSVAYRFDNSRLREEFGISYPPYRETVQKLIAEVRGHAAREHFARASH
jgi:nucleoside-diphosphate-sugar epimerase